MAHWQDAAVTNSGVEMLNEWMAGRSITITSAYGGTGTVAVEELMEQTGLADRRQKLNLLGEENGADGKVVQVQVSNAGLEEEYELNQVGVYAALDVDRDPEAEERLLFIMQDAKGVTVPAAADVSFLLELYCLIGITNNGRFQVSVDAAGMVTAGFLRETLANALQSHNADTGAHPDIRVYVDQSITDAVGPGLPPGGSVGQVLTKKSGGKHEFEWSRAAGEHVGKKSFKVDGGIFENTFKAGTGAEIFNCTGIVVPSEDGFIAPSSNNIAIGDFSHAEGYYTIASNGTSHVEGARCVATGIQRALKVDRVVDTNVIQLLIHSQYDNPKKLFNSFQIGDELVAFLDTGTSLRYVLAKIDSVDATNYSFTVGRIEGETMSESDWESQLSHAFMIGPRDYVLLYDGTGSSAHVEGSCCLALGASAHAEGDKTAAMSDYAHSEGFETCALSRISHAGGEGTITGYRAQTAIGMYNIKDIGGLWDSTNLFVIGNGANKSSRSNVFRVSNSAIFGTGSYNTTGADYAELFEWADGNPDKEDRIGRFVTMEGEKIQIASPDDSFILGVISGCPSVIGDVHDDQWQGMYLYDIFGRPLWEDVVVPEETVMRPDPENPEKFITEIISPAHIEHRRKLNPNYDSTQKYVPRTERPEWGCVGMMGKLVVIDDGTCQVNGWCSVGEGGIAVNSLTPTRYRVMSRLDATHIRILIL